MLRKLLLTAVLFVSAGVPAFAQSGTLTGTVTDAKTGKPIIGANLYIDQIQRGAATNQDGEYTISKVPTGTYTIRITYIGYNSDSETIKVETDENVFDFELKPGSMDLDETVVTGYGGVVSKRELTGSISSVSNDDFRDVPTQNTGGILQGRVSGVKVTSTSGTPGSGFNIQIRGQGSINAGNRPLYIVDGVEISYDNQNGANDNTPLNAIDPSDIKSIEVLKDAAASAIYGAQAANGVVLVTTKRGNQNTQISARYTRGATSFIRNNDYFNRDQFIEFFKAGLQYDNPGKTPQQIDQQFRDGYLPNYGFDTNTPYNQLPNTNWFDFNTRTGISKNYHMSLSGGDKNSSYRISGGYENTEGYIKKNDYQNYVFNGNFDQQISSKFSTQINVDLSHSKFVGPCQDGFYINCPISQAAFSSPLSRPYLDDGVTPSPDFPFSGATNNPVIQFNHRRRETNVLQILGSVAGTYDFTSWLSLRTQFSLDYRKEDETFFQDAVANPGDNGSLTNITAPTSNFQNSTTLSFNKSVNEIHNLSGLVGFSYKRVYLKQFSGAGIGFPLQTFDVLNSTATPTGAFGYNNEYRQAGYFGQIKYNYDQRYFAKFSARYDGSSRFGANNRFGFFPAGSVGWALAQEDFFKADFVDQLRLRASYGITGNSLLGYHPALGLYNTSGSYQGATGLRPTQLANRNLTWEQSAQSDIGLDYSFFDGRVRGAIDVYRKINSDLLLNRPLPLDSGFGSITQNIGEVRNQGVEFNVNTVNVRNENLQWSTRFNISINQNRVQKLSGNEQALNPGTTQPVAVGHSIRAWSVVEYAGVNPADGRPMWYDKNHNLTYTPDDNNDRIYYDGAEEDAYGGFGTTFSYKGLTLDAFLQYSYGQTAIPRQVTAFGIAQVGGSQTNGVVQRLTDAWRKPGDVKPYPAPTTGFAYPGTEGYYKTSTDKLYNTTYLRLKNITLSYSLPSTITDKASLQKVRFFVTALNLVTWTNYIGFDPEVAGNVTLSSIPVGRTVNGGIEVNF